MFHNGNEKSDMSAPERTPFYHLRELGFGLKGGWGGGSLRKGGIPNCFVIFLSEEFSLLLEYFSFVW